MSDLRILCPLPSPSPWRWVCMQQSPAPRSSQHTHHIAHSYTPWNQFFYNLTVFWKLPLCQEPSHGIGAPFCVCERPAFSLFGVLLGVYCVLSLAVKCLYICIARIFLTPWNPHLCSSAALRTPIRIPLLPPQYSSPSSHIFSVKKLKLWTFGHQWLLKPAHNRDAFKQVSTSINLTLDDNVPYLQDLARWHLRFWSGTQYCCSKAQT